MKRATREWVRKAEADYQAAVALAHASKPLHDQTCFHCQQSAEKYLKALLEEQATPVEKTHELARLLNCVLPQYRALRALRRGLLFLTNFAVETRYPGNDATRRQATSALRWAAKVRDACRAILGIPPPRARRHRVP